MSRYSRYTSLRETQQTKPIPGRAARMVANDGGGYSFAVDCWTRLNRFLILGCEGGHFQVGEGDLTLQNANCIFECLDQNPTRTVDTIVEISEAGRAPKQAPAVFALALVAGSSNITGRALALKALPKVCRIFTDLADFIDNVTQFRGWGRGLKRAVADWYNHRPVEELAYQMTKYRNRNGYTQRDMLRLAHPDAGKALSFGTKAFDPDNLEVSESESSLRNRLYRWAVGKQTFDNYLPPFHPLNLVYALEYLKQLPPEREVIQIVRDYGLVREHIPTEYLNSVGIWDALLQKMPITALIRNLGKMTSIGLVAPMSNAARLVCEKLRDAEYLRKKRVHPFGVVLAQTTYAAGCGVKGELTWRPVPQVNDALNDAFYSSFLQVRPTGKRHYLAIDVSGSMSWGSSKINNTHITARVGAACMAMVTLRTEDQSYALAFADKMHDLGLSRSMRLDDVVRRCEDAPASYTDCSAPIRDAMDRNIPVDVFVVYTDNDTNSGQSEHPIQALERYRQRTGINAKLAVVAMCANGHSIADPNDAGTMDISGFDADCPAILSEFAGYAEPVRKFGRKAA